MPGLILAQEYDVTLIVCMVVLHCISGFKLVVVWVLTCTAVQEKVSGIRWHSDVRDNLLYEFIHHSCKREREREREREEFESGALHRTRSTYSWADTVRHLVVQILHQPLQEREVNNYSSFVGTWVFLIKRTLNMLTQRSLWKLVMEDNSVVHHRGRRFRRATDKTDASSLVLPPPTPPSGKSREFIDASFSYKVVYQ